MSSGEMLEVQSVLIQCWPALMDREQAMAYLSCSETALKRFVSADQIKPVLSGSLLRYRKRDLDLFIDQLPEDSSATRRVRRKRTAKARGAKG